MNPVQDPGSNDVYCGGSKPAFINLKTFTSCINWDATTKDPYSGTYRYQDLEEFYASGRSKKPVNPQKQKK